MQVWDLLEKTMISIDHILALSPVVTAQNLKWRVTIVWLAYQRITFFLRQRFPCFEEWMGRETALYPKPATRRSVDNLNGIGWDNTKLYPPRGLRTEAIFLTDTGFTSSVICISLNRFANSWSWIWIIESYSFEIDAFLVKVLLKKARTTLAVRERLRQSLRHFALLFNHFFLGSNASALYS